MTTGPIGPHQRVFEYDGSFQCVKCQGQWGALPGNPAMPAECVKWICPHCGSSDCESKGPRGAKCYERSEAALKQRLEAAEKALRKMVDAMRRYQMDVDDPPPYEHRMMMEEAERALRSIREFEQVEAQHEETGHTWRGLRASLPERYLIVSNQFGITEAEWDALTRGREGA